MRTLCSFIISGMLLCFGKLQAQDKAPIILISTQNTALVYTTNAKKQLTQLYLGQLLTNTSDYPLKSQTIYRLLLLRVQGQFANLRLVSFIQIIIRLWSFNTLITIPKLKAIFRLLKSSLKILNTHFMLRYILKLIKMKTLLNSGQKLNIRRKRPLH